MSYTLRQATLTSGSAGEDATATTTPSVIGKLVKIEVMNSATAQPSDNWDLTVYTGTTGGNDAEILFLDETVSQANTSKVVYDVVKPASKAADGSASTLTEVHPVVFQKEVKLIGANMGNSKSAQVMLIFEV